MRLLLHLTWRSLVATWRSSLLLVLAVVVGTAFQIPNTANLAGYAAELMSKGLVSGHVSVTERAGGFIDDADQALARVRSVPEVTGAVARIEHAAVLQLHREAGDLMRPVPLVGLDARAESAVTGFCGDVARGACLGDTPGREPEVLVGSRLAAELAIGVGDRVRLIVPYETLGDVELASQRYRVVGVLGPSGGFGLDLGVAIDLGFLQRLFDRAHGATHLQLFTADPARAAATADAVARAVPELAVAPWTEARTFLRNAIASSTVLTTLSTSMVMLAVLVPVMALLFIQVLHERRQTATLAALGFDRRALFGIALGKAAIVGVAGTAIGAAIGIALCAYFSSAPIFAMDGFEIRPVLTFGTVFWPVAVVLGTTLASGVLPAARAASANPAAMLREG